jgi:hypothetical protein
MSKPHDSTQEKLESQLSKLKRKDFRDNFWTIVILTIAAAFLIFRIATVISHHI